MLWSDLTVNTTASARDGACMDAQLLPILGSKSPAAEGCSLQGYSAPGTSALWQAHHVQIVLLSPAHVPLCMLKERARPSAVALHGEELLVIVEAVCVAAAAVAEVVRGRAGLAGPAGGRPRHGHGRPADRGLVLAHAHPLSRRRPLLRVLPARQGEPLSACGQAGAQRECATSALRDWHPKRHGRMASMWEGSTQATCSTHTTEPCSRLR